MVGPWVSYLERIVRGAFDEMSDIQFLAIKEFDGKLVKNMGAQRTTIGTLATLTASSGKDMYIARAKISAEISSSIIEVELRINGVAVETVVGSTSTFENYEFKNIGHKVAATQVISLEWTLEGGSARVEGFIECFEEDTGTSPQIPPLNPV